MTLNFFLTLAASFVTVAGWTNPAITHDATTTLTEPKYCLSLNGTGYADAAPILGGLSQATMMGWFKMNDQNNATTFLIGQDNFHLKLLTSGSSRQLVATAKNESVTGPHNIVANRWYHIAVIYDAGGTEKLSLYVNGQKKASSTTDALSGSLAPSAAKFTIGRNPVMATEFFSGLIDEIRVFNVALSQDALQKMIFQEINAYGSAIRGEAIPRNIENTQWNSLLAYFRMDPTDSLLPDMAPAPNLQTPARVYNASFAPQQAPLPFVTQAPGNLETAIGLDSLLDAQEHYPWSVIHVMHDINLAANRTTLGLIVDADATITLNNDNKLQNTWYLKLDGKIDLRGKSQLIQTAHSELDPTSAGFIERHQQGQSNRYNYNYWCSPVGPVNSATNNNPYSVDGVLRDATDPQNPQFIQWTTLLDGEPTTPITLSSYWIFKFQNMTPNYANWSSVGAFGNLLPAQGFTLKGSSPEAGIQNFAFVGKPNNGTITTTILPGNLNLTGNPYPSALDANQFLLENYGKINGTLYFWEHVPTNNTHLLVDYQGGYATRNLVGGTPSFALRQDQEQVAASKIPGRFVPVGQGFFVRATSLGGNIVFSNSQRAFIKEDTNVSNPLFRQQTFASETDDNANDAVSSDGFARIRLGFDSPNHFHRQVLLGFMNEFASSGINLGYDSDNIDTQPYDFYLMNSGHPLIISGEGFFNASMILPLGVKAAIDSTVKLMLDATENFDPDQPIYIFDDLSQTYYDLRNGPVEVTVAAGTNTTRFSLRFHNPTLKNDFFETPGQISIGFTSSDNNIVIENKLDNTIAETVSLYNMLGQRVGSWPVANLNQTKIQIPVQAHAGTYIVQVHTSGGDISKRIIVR